MDEKEKNLVVSPEEQKADEEGTKEVNSEELKDKIAQEMGLNPDEDSELLEKIFKREQAHHERLSGAIKQKISYREKFKNLTSEKPPTKEAAKATSPQDIDKMVDEKLNARWEERELDALNLSDDIRVEVKDLAKLKGITVREAHKLPYIQSRIMESSKKDKLLKNTPKRGGQGGSYQTNIDITQELNPQDFDLSTEEGRKAWNEAKSQRREYLKNK